MSEHDRNLRVIGGRAYSTQETIKNTFDLCSVAILKGIEGDFVECGVGSGAQIGVMGYANGHYNGNKKIWAFDSYQGIPIASVHDESQPGIGTFKPAKTIEERLISSGITSHPLWQVKSHLNEWNLPLDQFEFIEGWFEETLPEYSDKIESISVLRLDGDLYYSTLVCLEYLYPKLSKGGFLIIDDWELAGCRKACNEYLNYSELSEAFKIKNSTPVWFEKL